ncbi:centromere/kinetochore protein zw10 homolog [Ischnura elegans]|uniref:centromere/kinetochore protein zw10 homolog n=1 Tax=Ischnura elegans TaxID=197161 RepID=UPI001ED8B095|nr:centromere/kinetochore protein zw10 homolog [Ischnura elegans]
MSSYIHEALRPGKILCDDLDGKIRDITERSYSIKCELKEVMEKQQIRFYSTLDESQVLIDRAKSLRSEMESLQNNIDGEVKTKLTSSTGEMKRLTEALQEVSLMLNFVNELVELDRLLTKAKEKQNEKCYLETAELLKEANVLIQEPSNFIHKLEIFPILKENSTLLREKFIYDMSEIWKACVQVKYDETVDETKITILKVKMGCAEELRQLAMALEFYNELSFKVNRFGTHLLSHILEPVILHECAVIANDEKNCALLEVQFQRDSEKPSFQMTLENLKFVFNFLNEHLNFKLKDDIKLLEKIGLVTSDDFCDCFIKSCLSDTVPCSSEELVKFDEVIQQTEEFQSFLMDVGFFTPHKDTIIGYARNVDVLFANKLCQNVLAKSRNIMQEFLHVTVEVGLELATDELSIQQEDNSPLESFKPTVLLNSNTFQFPKCAISASTVKLLKLLNEVLEQSVNSKELCSVRLFHTARNVVELYCSIMPLHHKEFLDTIPQQSAIFHNNCMYLAHHLLTLGHEYQDRLPAVLHEQMTTFIDQVLVLRNIGSSIFLKQMQKQRDQLLEIVRDSGIHGIGTAPELPNSTEKGMRQCLRQLEHLKTVWLNVLPYNVYCKSIGSHLNSFVEELIFRVLAAEDIPSSTAVQLVTVFGVVSGRAPQLFQEPGEIFLHVRSWPKFKELILVLGSSLRDIDGRWADGKGPLADIFQVDEVRKLILALFKNSERRAATLRLIK